MDVYIFHANSISYKKKKKESIKSYKTHPIIVLVAIMKSVTSVFITFALKSFDFV